MVRATRNQVQQGNAELAQPHQDPDAIGREPRRRARNEAARSRTTRTAAATQSGQDVQPTSNNASERAATENGTENETENRPSSEATQPVAPGESVVTPREETPVNDNPDPIDNEGPSTEAWGDRRSNDPAVPPSNGEAPKGPSGADEGDDSQKDSAPKPEGSGKRSPDPEGELPDPKRQRTASGQAAGAGNAPPVPTSCQNFRERLALWRILALDAESLRGDNVIARGRHLFDNAVHQAIASVTQAISEEGHASFSLVDRISRRTVRPGGELLYPVARSATTGGSGVGHWSLFHLHRRVDSGREWRLVHYDSYPLLRNAANPVWRETLLELRVLGWLDDRFVENLPDTYEDPGDQPRQRNSWMCGLFTIFNAWVQALGLTLAPQTEHDASVANRLREFEDASCEVVELAMRGCLSSVTIRDFLDCYGIIVANDQVRAGRRFLRTLAFPDPANVTAYVNARLAGPEARQARGRAWEEYRARDQELLEFEVADLALEQIHGSDWAAVDGPEMLRRYLSQEWPRTSKLYDEPGEEQQSSTGPEDPRTEQQQGEGSGASAAADLAELPNMPSETETTNGRTGDQTTSQGIDDLRNGGAATTADVPGDNAIPTSPHMPNATQGEDAARPEAATSRPPNPPAPEAPPRNPAFDNLRPRDDPFAHNNPLRDADPLGEAYRTLGRPEIDALLDRIDQTPAGHERREAILEHAAQVRSNGVDSDLFREDTGLNAGSETLDADQETHQQEDTAGPVGTTLTPEHMYSDDEQDLDEHDDDRSLFGRSPPAGDPGQDDVLPQDNDYGEEEEEARDDNDSIS